MDRFDLAKHAAEAESKFSRDSERFPLAGVGDVNTFALFAELSRHLISPTGRAGIIVPLGLATNDQLSSFFGYIFREKSLVSLIVSENEDCIFLVVAIGVRF